MNYFQKIDQIHLRGVEKKKFQTKQGILRYLILHEKSGIRKISKNLSLSIPSTQSALNELIEQKLIETKGQGKSSGGRRPSIYGISKDSFYILSIDIGRFQARMAIIDSDLKIVGETISLDLGIVHQSTEYLKELIESAKKLIADRLGNTNKLIGVGFSMPGLINSQKGINYSYLYDPNESLVSKIKKEIGVPVYLENDANARAITEQRRGKVRGAKNALVILISWGIGVGIVSGGKIYRGASGFSGELSHIPFVENGKLCYCNKRGCFETVASATALSDLVIEGMEKGERSSIFKQLNKKDELVDPDIVIKAAKEGDQFAISTLHEIGYALGKGLSILVQTLNPEVIVFGGRMARAEQFITAPIEQAMNTYCNPFLLKNLKIELTKLSREAALLGSAMGLISYLLDKENCM